MSITQEQREQFAIEDWLPKITAADLIDQLYEAEDVFMEAVQAGDAAMIGEVVLAVRKAYARRLAVRELYDEPVQVPTVTQAAALAVIQHQVRKSGLEKMGAHDVSR